jgi:RNA polymerase sigma factor (TIGR02999 family)
MAQSDQSANSDPRQPSASLDEIFPRLYAELRQLARQQLGRERDGHTLNTTALVHEAYLRLAKQTHVAWEDPARVMGVAAYAMRRVLVDHARRYLTTKRGGSMHRVNLDEGQIVVDARADEIVAIDGALERLHAVDARLCRVVECRFFSGLTDEETSKILGVTPRTVQRDWIRAKAWLYRELHG